LVLSILFLSKWRNDAMNKKTVKPKPLIKRNNQKEDNNNNNIVYEVQTLLGDVGQLPSLLSLVVHA